jgi:UDP-2,3-diacylglucosamine pyrophosphatase LpxH
VCEDSTTCFFVGGGRDNIVRNNICRNVGTCLHLDDRGLNWQAASCTFNASYAGDLVQGLFAVKYQQPPFSTTFPEIVGTLANRPCTPVNVSFTGNSACNATKLIDASLADLAKWGDVFAGNTNTSVC